MCTDAGWQARGGCVIYGLPSIIYDTAHSGPPFPLKPPPTACARPSDKTFAAFLHLTAWPAVVAQLVSALRRGGHGWDADRAAPGVVLLHVDLLDDEPPLLVLLALLVRRHLRGEHKKLLRTSEPSAELVRSALAKEAGAGVCGGARISSRRCSGRRCSRCRGRRARPSASRAPLPGPSRR